MKAIKIAATAISVFAAGFFLNMAIKPGVGTAGDWALFMACPPANMLYHVVMGP